ncbi:4-alpha-glucanotransferase [Sporobacter termitidis DSM 10068]|uniref:4-alpha-glucanotransferase n=1 Tax=Sporobacter termitidis DSM 10068 TaxID=1123282 RepID=A0A1M5YNP3_9FIRM|nr:4-alpha-glucanotransferase [Sporobacter termitidis]SHI13474.1 4-alpha-glucanotransferase [Sporobacter termitidis DSM 10068]
MEAYHNSHDLNYRNPFGAVRAGEAVRLSLDVAAVSCSLVLWRDGREVENVPMAREESGQSRFSVTIQTPPEGALLWYYFAVRGDDGGIRYYGNNDARLGGPGRLSETAPAPYQITVYEESGAPAWFEDAVVYQLFPDRFRRGGDWEERRKNARRPEGWRGPARVFQEDWHDTPFYTKNAGGAVTRWPFFGGTLTGIREKLLYLKSLGVGAIYLNPIFEAASNHRYDTADYMKLDPALGDGESFKSLAKAAGALGIRLILDGVFSHTGADSVYFDKYGNYGGAGAYRGPSSPYYDWYRFDSFPDKYDSWWGVDDLPKVDKNQKSYRDFIYGGPDSVVRHWLEQGAAGWRLDVADELPDDFIRGIRRAMEETTPGTLLLGEVWEDASNKVSYGVRRTYLLGGALQSVMNYPFRLSALDYMLGKSSAFDLAAALMSLKENYPPEQLRSALNLVGSHDRVRALTALGDAPENLPDGEKEYYTLPPDKYALAKARLKLLSLIQFTAEGVPCVYYGDEAGAQGFEDPLNRAPFPWGREDPELLDHYRLLGLLRRQYRPLRRGEFVPEGLTAHVFSISRRAGDEEVRLIVNRGIFERETVTVQTGAGYILDLLTSEELPGENGTLTVTLEPLTARLLYLKSAPPARTGLPRAAGILCALGSVPSERAEGGVTLGDIRRFIDFLADSGQRLWQLLPLNPAGKGGSPFYSPSLFALGGALPDGDASSDAGAFEEFCRENAYWLDDDALYWTLKEKNGGLPWQDWPEDERTRENLEALFEEHRDGITRHKKTQFRRQRCWLAAKQYANSRGVSIIGDLPVYAAPDGADVWTHQSLFRLDEKGNAALHGGVPPDYFSPEGQDWGNPLYDWESDKDGVYLFWELRLRRALELYDTVRLDHFRSFSAYFAIPDGARPSEGQWLIGAGIEFFDEMRRRLGRLPAIAEDLGALDMAVNDLLKLSGLPGMLVWQFSADEMEAMTAAEAARRVFYSGTHDNQTSVGWCEECYPGDDPVKKANELVEKLYAAHAPWVITPLQDVIGLGDEARMNTPGTTAGNWTWRADRARLTPALSAKLRGWAEKYGR